MDMVQLEEFRNRRRTVLPRYRYIFDDIQSQDIRHGIYSVTMFVVMGIRKVTANTIDEQKKLEFFSSSQHFFQYLALIWP
jgi:hypothetical protein